MVDDTVVSIITWIYKWEHKERVRTSDHARAGCIANQGP